MPIEDYLNAAKDFELTLKTLESKHSRNVSGGSDGNSSSDSFHSARNYVEYGNEKDGNCGIDGDDKVRSYTEDGNHMSRNYVEDLNWNKNCVKDGNYVSDMIRNKIDNEIGNYSEDGMINARNYGQSKDDTCRNYVDVEDRNDVYCKNNWIRNVENEYRNNVDDTSPERLKDLRRFANSFKQVSSKSQSGLRATQSCQGSPKRPLSRISHEGQDQLSRSSLNIRNGSRSPKIYEDFSKPTRQSRSSFRQGSQNPKGALNERKIMNPNLHNPKKYDLQGSKSSANLFSSKVPQNTSDSNVSKSSVNLTGGSKSPKKSLNRIMDGSLFSPRFLTAKTTFFKWPELSRVDSMPNISQKKQQKVFF